jgi:hypothetical protein
MNDDEQYRRSAIGNPGNGSILVTINYENVSARFFNRINIGFSSPCGSS